MTNTALFSEKVVIAYEKRGNAGNYINTLKGTGKPSMTGTPHHVVIRGMSVGRLFKKSFWTNEAIFQLMMISYILFLLFKLDFLGISEFRQHIKTFRLKYVFLAGKIIRTARYVVMKLLAKYSFRAALFE